ncbi:hypothetical protein AVO42_00410 [Thiomicrospira sp. XS5]|uniref:DUF3486 family protein n=1 Tax=Thiomicrospira sp. XS5 TaxID=1775636 RepID=UPI000747808A|nr:DUF3486 family protein [Thiomicrospira sp. XS5]KUJ73918.1 hypothetical protein AVO42_00410 [Thiomicrospira sp. XS5]
MARTSTIEKLPQDILDKLQELLRDPRVNQLDATARINAILAEQGHDKVSKSAVNRYAQRMAKVGQKLQEAREVSKMFIDRFGEDQTGEVGKLVNEMVRTLIFDITLKMQGEAIDPDMAPELAKMVKNLGDAMNKLEQAAAINSKRERELKQQAAEELAQAAEKQASTQNGSITPEQLRDIIAGAYAR